MEDLFKMVPAGCLLTISKKTVKIKWHKVLKGVMRVVDKAPVTPFFCDDVIV